VLKIRPAPEEPLRPVHVSGVDLRTVLQQLREQCESQVEEMRRAYATATVLARQTSELRELCRATRDGARRGRG
jgi:hypothetical protein